ncbi:hypothetical protein F5X71_08355 [Nocardia brasiliensis]|uniref:Uncharacterized protein n=1 Tax=Nocardia brasiliensis TaxID=37326 RepID=A0A6G9XN07_NOCBR|nr:hypothetical protein [Nocardia brasiliensis]QIS02332.1 hypothetical protein F5X71_08355 [Nocardia brasiliensis]
MSGFLDPDGARHGLPTWPWGMAPQHLRTWRQLDAENKRPVGEYEAQVRGAGWRQAYLYDSREVRPKREPSAAQLESLQIARWTRSVDACERRGIDATDMREVIEQARADIAAQRAARQVPRGGRERNR